ncbi:hypothetical protein BJ742DRAFT_871332 [Cladochytrium replicatum]|nr:hypothetical protein BJ742DRAFT_871332 [Cladochytrium replicatum]
MATPSGAASRISRSVRLIGVSSILIASSLKSVHITNVVKNTEIIHAGLTHVRYGDTTSWNGEKNMTKFAPVRITWMIAIEPMRHWTARAMGLVGGLDHFMAAIPMMHMRPLRACSATPSALHDMSAWVKRQDGRQKRSRISEDPDPQNCFGRHWENGIHG